MIVVDVIVVIVDAFFFCRQMESTVQPLLPLSSRSRRLRWLGLQDRSVFTKKNQCVYLEKYKMTPSQAGLVCGVDNCARHLYPNPTDDCCKAP